MTQRAKSWFFNFPNFKDRFRRGNKPTQATFEDLLDSVYLKEDGLLTDTITEETDGAGVLVKRNVNASFTIGATATAVMANWIYVVTATGAGWAELTPTEISTEILVKNQSGGSITIKASTGTVDGAASVTIPDTEARKYIYVGLDAWESF
jgi:hypothetical protein